MHSVIVAWMQVTLDEQLLHTSHCLMAVDDILQRVRKLQIMIYPVLQFVGILPMTRVLLLLSLLLLTMIWRQL